MKATLEFELPQESEEHSLAVNGWKYRMVLSEMDQWLRKLVKYGEENSDEINGFCPSNVRERLWKMMEEEGLSLD